MLAMADTASPSSAPVQDPPPASPNRYITTHNAEAKAVFAAVPAPLQVVRDLDGTQLRLGYLNSRHPVSLADNKDVNSYAQALDNPPALVPPGGGTVIWYIDVPPGSKSPLHRTTSIDFVIHVEGEIELQLDGGETRITKPGDITIQRATMHAWRNMSQTKWARMIGVIQECEPPVVGGQTLETYFPLEEGL